MKVVNKMFQRMKHYVWHWYNKSLFVKRKRHKKKRLKEKRIIDGVVYQKWKVINETKSIVHILTVDATKREIELMMHDVPETITSTAKKHKETSAFVNAGFFHLNDAHTIQTLIKDNEIKNLGYFNQDDETGYFYKPSGIAINNNQLKMFHYQLQVVVETLKPMTFLFSPINSDDHIVYQAQVKPHVIAPNKGDFYVVIDLTNQRNLKLNKIYRVNIQASGTLTSDNVPSLTRNTYAFIVPKQHQASIAQLKAQLEEGFLSIKIKLYDETTQSEMNVIDTFLGSGPLLVDEYTNVLLLPKSSPKGQLIAPRTAIATNNDGRSISFIVVDGRLPFYSDGMTLQQLTDMLMTFGYEQALNLDGGSSSSMVINAKEINKRTAQPLRKLPHVFRIK